MDCSISATAMITRIVLASPIVSVLVEQAVVFAKVGLFTFRTAIFLAHVIALFGDFKEIKTAFKGSHLQRNGCFRGSYVWTIQSRALRDETIGDQIGIANAFRAFQRRPGDIYLVEDVVKYAASLLHIVDLMSGNRAWISLEDRSDLVVVVVFGFENASFTLIDGHRRGHRSGLVLLRRNSCAGRFTVIDAF